MHTVATPAAAGAGRAPASGAPAGTIIRAISHGDFLLWRKVGDKLRKGLPGGPRGEGGNPRFRHPTQAAAEAEAGRLLALFPDSTFIVLHEVARVKLKAVDSDAATGCADDQAFAIGGGSVRP